MNLLLAKKKVLWTIVAILFFTVLEFPAPIGFETRPQDNVSLFWLGFFLIILVTEVAAMRLVFTRPMIGLRLATISATLNILQVLADMNHLMQPEVATLGYSMLEMTVAVLSFALIYFGFRVFEGLQKPT